ncbi:hypothetical protein [Prosthecobacter debontii]|uniref:hypothetical protein n=1 Tax=Prosthecobacter debontii TaxID=48467 RepID=UPI0015914E5D|nr:hypothetical protein [Prosthecobacter debontii]
MATTIRLRSVRTLAALEPLLAQGAKFRFAIPVADIEDAIKQNVGLPEPLKPGMFFFRVSAVQSQTPTQMVGLL